MGYTEKCKSHKENKIKDSKGCCPVCNGIVINVKTIIKYILLEKQLDYYEELVDLSKKYYETQSHIST
jgi:hypothetical protein